MEKKLTSELLHIFNSIESSEEYMHNPIYNESNHTVYSVSSYMCIKCDSEDCVSEELSSMKVITDFFDNPDEVIENFENLFTLTEIFGEKTVNVQKLSDLINSKEKIEETLWIGKEEQCSECDGRGTVFVDYLAETNNRMYYIEAECPICNGSGTVDNHHEVKTGRKIIPYYTDIDFGLNYTIRAGMFESLIPLLNYLDIKEFTLKQGDSAKFFIELDENIRIILSGTMCNTEYGDNTLKYIAD